MKQKLQYLLGAAVIAILLVAAPLALAEDSTAVSTNTDSSSSGSSQTDTTQNQTQLKERIAKFKTDFKVSLTSAQQSKIKLRCTASQTTVGSLNVKFSDKVKVRTQAYTELGKHLSDIITKLKAAKIDTTQLQDQKTVLDTKISNYKTDLDKYTQALSDIKSVACVSDPAAFQAALDAARAAHQTLTTDAADIRSYVTGTIKTTLKTLRTQLSDKSKSSTSGSAE